MSKELTPLEVSNQLKDFVLEFVKNGLDRRFIHGSFDIIETALKELEVKREVIGDILTGNDEKKLQAFEIIKESDILVVDDYPEMLRGIGGIDLTDEEYDLLKEVLNNGR